MDMKAAKVLAEFLLLLGPDVLEVLVAEYYNTTLGYQQRELILLGVGQLGQLQARDLGADTRCQFGDLQVGSILGQKVGFCGIRVVSPVLEVK